MPPWSLKKTREMGPSSIRERAQMLEAQKKGSAAEVKEDELHDDRRRRVPVIG